jgi:hypothetical protein
MTYDVHGNMDEKYIHKWATGTLSNHKYRGFDIKITTRVLEDIAKYTPTCYYCGVNLDWDGNDRLDYDNPSLDRKNNDNVISVENVRILCHGCNSMKGRRTENEFFAYCIKIANRFDIYNNELHIEPSHYKRCGNELQTHSVDDVETILQFLNDCVLEYPVVSLLYKKDFITKKDLYNRYVEHCKKYGRFYCKSVYSFGRHLSKVNFPYKFALKSVKGIQKPSWVGIKLK